MRVDEDVAYGTNTIWVHTDATHSKYRGSAQGKQKSFDNTFIVSSSQQYGTMTNACLKESGQQRRWRLALAQLWEQNFLKKSYKPHLIRLCTSIDLFKGEPADLHKELILKHDNIDQRTPQVYSLNCSPSSTAPSLFSFIRTQTCVFIFTGRIQNRILCWPGTKCLNNDKDIICTQNKTWKYLNGTKGNKMENKDKS